MRSIVFFVLGTAALWADDFTTGQAARAVIGQETFTAQLDQPSASVLGGVSGIAYSKSNDTLIVADSNRVSAAPLNHRVLLFQNLSSMLPLPGAQLDYSRKCPVCIGQASLVLGQPDFTTNAEPSAPNLTTQSNLRLPTAVATDGVHVAVADTNHNRVLIWNSFPASNNQPADVVVGQPDFKTASVPGNTPNQKSMRGPQGVWIQDGRLYVADTQNNRILVYNRIPTSNGAAADLVLGAPDFTTFVEPDLTQQKFDAKANNLLNPVAVTSDGARLFITDLGFQRVLIWNRIPTSNGAAADVVIGQPDMTSAISNNSFSIDPNDTNRVEHAVLCTVSNGKDTNGNPTYPPHCNATLSFPRFALSDGTRLFVADGGNDRVLVFNQIPTQNGQSADYVIGQLGGEINQASDAADSLRSPMGLAWDGTNLFVTDAFNRRITVYSVGANAIPYSGVRNAASLKIFALGAVTFSGSITADNYVTVVIGNSATNASSCTAPTASSTGASTTNCGNAYTYKIQKDDTLDKVVDALVSQINSGNSGSGDPNVFAYPDHIIEAVLLTAKVEGVDGNNVTISTTVSTSATITATTSGANLTGGGDASKLGPGTTVSILGSNLSANKVDADLTKTQLPTSLGNTTVYMNGIAAPLYFVSPSQINAQIPWEVFDTTSINVYVRSVMNDGSIVVTTPIAVTIVPQNPGIYTDTSDTDPKPGKIFHGSSQATGVILVDGSVNAGDVATVKIEDRSYSYTVQSTDTLDTIRDALVVQINQDPKVSATAGITFARNVQIRARISGPDGNGIPFSATTTNSGGSPQLVLTPTNTALCCANIAGSKVTTDNPAVPGETILVYATGLGLPVLSDDNRGFINTGTQYPQGGPVTIPVNFVSSLAGGKTANVLSASLKPGMPPGTYEVVLQLNSDMPSDPFTHLYIAQDVYISNIVTFPLVNPAQ
ncbi:MAG: hypothetical protein C5B51_26790 [Terriglobia bacterium]|nr:MAG: hypothetical protein C5B51_26790 [Terriglobia bacterium]